MLEYESLRLRLIVRVGIESRYVDRVFPLFFQTKNRWFVGRPLHSLFVFPATEPFLVWILAVAVAGADDQFRPCEVIAPEHGGGTRCVLAKQI